MMYISVKQAAENWAISDRRVRLLCSEGRIPGVIREGRSWRIPAEAEKPGTDAISPQKTCLRVLTGRKKNWIPDVL